MTPDPITKMTEVNRNKTLLMSLAVLLWVLFRFGFGLHSILIFGPVIVILNICFATWLVGNATERAVSLLKRSSLFAFLVGASCVLWVWATSPGQLGYGEYLQFSGSDITPYGYRVIAFESIKLGVVVLIAASLICFKELVPQQR